VIKVRFDQLFSVLALYERQNGKLKENKLPYLSAARCDTVFGS